MVFNFFFFHQDGKYFTFRECGGYTLDIFNKNEINEEKKNEQKASSNILVLNFSIEKSVIFSLHYLQHDCYTIFKIT